MKYVMLILPTEIKVRIALAKEAFSKRGELLTMLFSKEVKKR